MPVQWLKTGWDTESCVGRMQRESRGLGERRRGHRSGGEMANQQCEFPSKWPLATSLTGSGVEGEELRVLSHCVIYGISRLTD